MKPLIRLVVLIALLLAAPLAGRLAAEEAGVPVHRPRLVVLISIDQFRADLLTRFSDLYLPAGSGSRPGGFRYLQSRGAWYADCRYEHHRTVTAAGHAILGTGAQPSVNGIVGNNWWDRAAGKSVYCVSDPHSKVVGAGPGSKEEPMSPANLLTTTVGDELELATGGRAKTVSLSLKDRAAILLCGHRADTALWLDEGTGGWVSSSYYCRDGNLPSWVAELNARRLPAQMREKPWEPVVDSAALERVWKVAGASEGRFSHPLTAGDYFTFATSPAGNQFVFETARQAVLSESLGQDEIPDILTINLASNDYVGHRYGPDSAEVMDISVQTDRQLSEFFTFLAKNVPGGLDRVTIVLSADHGVVTIPELNTTSGAPGGRLAAGLVKDAAEKALDSAIGPADWVAGIVNDEIYLSPATLEKFPREIRARIESVAAEAVEKVPGVYLAFARSDVLAGRVPDTAMGRRVARGLHPRRSGDVVFILDPGWLSGAARPVPPGLAGTSHGTPFPYDTHVPLLMAGAGVRRGIYLEPVSPARIAPTLSFLLGTVRPSGADEPLLPGLEGTQASAAPPARP